jgi:hypothetical protein
MTNFYTNVVTLVISNPHLFISNFTFKKGSVCIFIRYIKSTIQA